MINFPLNKFLFSLVKDPNLSHFFPKLGFVCYGCWPPIKLQTVHTNLTTTNHIIHTHRHVSSILLHISIFEIQIKRGVGGYRKMSELIKVVPFVFFAIIYINMQHYQTFTVCSVDVDKISIYENSVQIKCFSTIYIHTFSYREGVPIL